MRRPARLALLSAAVVGGCGDPTTGGALPPFAADLPGATVAVAWGPVAAELAAALDLASARRLGLEVERRPDLLAVSAPSLHVGWRRLADSATLQAAFAGLPEIDARRGGVYVDLQLGVDLLGERSSGGLPAGIATALSARVIGALGLRSLRSLLLAVDRDPAGWRAAGVLAHGAAAGVAGLLCMPPRPISGPGLAPAADGVELRGGFAPAAVRDLVRELLAGDPGGPLDAVAVLAQSRLPQAAIALLDCADGAFAATVDDGGVDIRLGIARADDAADALDDLGRPADGGWRLPGDFAASLADGVLVIARGR